MLGKGTLHVDSVVDNFTAIYKGSQYTLPGQEKVATGYFVVLPDAVGGQGVALFVNGQGISAVDLNGENFEQIVSEEGPGQFESAISLGGNHFAVAYGKGGVRVYSVSSDRTVKLEGELNKNSPGLAECDITDIAYDNNRKILFVLNRATGVLSLQLSFGV